MAEIAYYRNEKTGKLAPPHVIGEGEDGREIYQFVEGWEPVDCDGAPVECDCDYDGNWLAPAH